MQASFFFTQFDIQSAGVTLKNWVNVIICPHVPMVFLCKFDQNSPFGSGDTVQTRLIFSLYSVVTLKIR